MAHQFCENRNCHLFGIYFKGYYGDCVLPFEFRLNTLQGRLNKTFPYQKQYNRYLTKEIALNATIYLNLFGIHTKS